MATRTEQFRWQAERSGPKRPPRVDKARTVAEGPHPSARAAKKASYALEITAGKPSRKSSRTSANRQKTDGQFRMKRRIAEAQPRDQRPPR
jgi:hypothetical protein